MPILTLGPFDFFHHTQAVSVVTDSQSALLDNSDLRGRGGGGYPYSMVIALRVKRRKQTNKRSRPHRVFYDERD
jgi:NADH:ubiquinone oxidoreductase subunit F (NADH-binding)